MRFEAVHHARTPRVRCAGRGVRMIDGHRAGKGHRFTLRFEAFAVRILGHARGVKDACAILRMNRNVGQVGSLKEAFGHFWERRDRDLAERFFEYRHAEVVKSKPRP